VAGPHPDTDTSYDETLHESLDVNLKIYLLKEVIIRKYPVLSLNKSDLFQTLPLAKYNQKTLFTKCKNLVLAQKGRIV
jgi:hypothetical protein